MKFLHNPTTGTSKPINAGNMHPDALKTIDDRKEPLESAKEVDNVPLNKVVDDPTTDPDGAERRANTAEAFPAWVLEEYKLSAFSYWGKKNPDGLDHLIPKESLVRAVIQVHKDGEATIGRMLDLAKAGSNAINYKTLMESYEFIFNTVDKAYLYPIMNALSSTTRQAFVERAFTKYSFLSALARQKPDVDLPEYMDFLKERMIMAATMCGTWCDIHRRMWEIIEYKNSPTYLVDNEIKLKLCQNAAFLEKRNKPVEAPKPSAEDQRSLAALC